MLVGLACYRFTLINKGHFFWGDERCYLAAPQLVDDFAAGDYGQGIQRLFGFGARPVFVAVSVVPALLQRWVGGALNVAPDSLQSYDIVSAFNVLVTLGVTLCIFVLLRRWAGSAWYALLGAGAYSLLANANICIRHATPYNESLLLDLIALILIADPRASEKPASTRFVLAGIMTALGYACYPGHYAFVMINGVAAVAFARRRWFAAFGFVVSAAATLGAFELTSRLVDRSYFQSLRTLAGTVRHGHFDEGYLFLWRYLKEVEGPVGVTLFVLCGIFVMYYVSRLWRCGRRQTDGPCPGGIEAPSKNERQHEARWHAVLWTAVVAYAFHAALGVHFHRVVFYGRILVMYLPFVVMMGVLALTVVRWRTVRVIGACALVGSSVWSFLLFAPAYARLTYPADFLQQAMNGAGRDVSYPAYMLWGVQDEPRWVREGHPDVPIERLDPNIVMVQDTLPDGRETYLRLASHEAVGRRERPFIGVNIKWFGYVREADPHFDKPEGYRLVAEATHPAAFPATAYEGFKPWERRRLYARRYKMRIYERTDSATSLTMSSPE